MANLSYLVKLLLFLIGLVVSLEAISYLATRLVINQAVTQNARAELQAGGELFSRIMQNNVGQLVLSVKVLTEDFGFKDAVATNDENTIRSALTNHAARVKADIGIFISSSGQLVASSNINPASIRDEFSALKQQAQMHGKAYDTIIIDGKAYQFVMFSVKAPEVIGLAGMGFEVKHKFSEELKRLTNLEVSFLQMTADDVIYLTGTIEQQARAQLINQLEKHHLPGKVFEYGDLMSLSVPLTRQNNELFAVLQVPLSKVLAPFERLNIQLFLFALAFSALAALAALFLARSVTRPVTLLAEIAQKIAKGFYATPIKVTSKDELGQLASAFISMQKAISEREQEVIFQSEHDPLTGLPNRIRIFPELEKALADAVQGKTSVHTLIIDIKNFTQINDELSQEIGDGVLKDVGEKLKRAITHAKVLRLGSDEFLIIIFNQNHARITELAQHIHQLFASPLIINGLQVSIEVNIGIANFPDDADTAEILLRRANLALNHIRNSEHNSCFYQQGWDELHLRRLHLFREFENSLINHHITLHYQPKINLEKPDKLGAEALVRWNHPDMGFIAPDEFISVIESSGQITILTRWVLKTAIAQLKILLDEGINITLSVNLSALDLLVDDLPEYLGEHLQAYQVPAEKLCLEITESAIMREAEKSLRNLKRFESLGVILSIDDFGTGYSSLSQLKKLPVSELKIDKSFIMNLDTSADDQLIVRSTIDLGHTLGLSITAEGVESEAIKNLLKHYGCDTAQGYLYSKPLADKAFIDWIHQYLGGLAK